MYKEIKIGTATYRTTKMELFMQFHVTRKLLPVVVSFGSFADLKKRGNITEMFGPLALALARMSKEDSEEILASCLDCVQCAIPGVNNQWAPVKATGAMMLMDQSMTLPVLLALVRAVLEENLGNFFVVAALLFPEAFGTTDSSPSS